MNIQKKNQEIFEKQIDLLIMYKQAHLTENVYLNEVCLNKAIKWIQNININNIIPSND